MTELLKKALEQLARYRPKKSPNRKNLTFEHLVGYGELNLDP
jgi:hypothetical protein